MRWERAPGAANNQKWVVGSERVDMPRLCELFLGRRGKLYYVASVGLYIYASLWQYSVLVAHTLATAMPLFSSGDGDGGDGDGAAAAGLRSYHAYLAVFGLLATALSVQNLAGPLMTGLNLGFSWGRVLTALAMVGTLLFALARHALALYDDDGGVAAADGASTEPLDDVAPAPLVARLS